MLNVVCVNAGNYQGRGAEYVNTLFDMVRRNLPEGFPGRFVCFTDDATGLDVGITVRGLEPGLTGWWNKLALFKRGVFAEGDRVLYLDLGTVIVGKLDDLVAYDGPFAICRDFYRPDGLQSCVMAWAGDWSFLWNRWTASGRPQFVGGDQTAIERYLQLANVKPDILQDVFPGAFASFKLHCNPYPPKGAVIVNFHGDPKPHVCAEEWVGLTWKPGGGSAAELREICNTKVETLAANIRGASARDLPWLAIEPAHDGHAVIVGGAPSLKFSLREVGYRFGLGQTIFAVNGTHDYLVSEGIRPQCHVLVDARPENVEFLLAPQAANYYLASQCAPGLFDALKRENVTLFHCNTEGLVDLLPANDKPVNLVGGGNTVVLHTMALAYVLGYRKLHLYGVDSSITEIHHAYEQKQNDADRVMDVVACGRSFRCAPWMVGQAEKFQEIAIELAALGCVITVHGDGLIPHLAKSLALDPPIHAADVRAHEILSRLGDGPKVGTEVGVFGGDLSARLLAREDLTLNMVDSWEADGAAYVDKGKDFHAALPAEKQSAYLERTKAVTAFANGRGRILRQRSDEAARAIAPRSQDFVFIDADHSYEGCKRDIEAWRERVRVGGLLCGHDYGQPEFPGVQRAVDEFVAREGLKLERGDNFTWFVQEGQ